MERICFLPPVGISSRPVIYYTGLNLSLVNWLTISPILISQIVQFHFIFQYVLFRNNFKKFTDTRFVVLLLFRIMSQRDNSCDIFAYTHQGLLLWIKQGLLLKVVKNGLNQFTNCLRVNNRIQINLYFGYARSVLGIEIFRHSYATLSRQIWFLLMTVY